MSSCAVTVQVIAQGLSNRVSQEIVLMRSISRPGTVYHNLDHIHHNFQRYEKTGSPFSQTLFSFFQSLDKHSPKSSRGVFRAKND